MIDQHWREHLYEMDYLREGINLRAMGQKDPLAEWQREGFDMFEAMMGQIQDQFVAYVSHLQVAAVEEAPRAPSNQGMRYSSAEDAVQGSGAMRATAASMPVEELAGSFDGLGGGGGGPEALPPEPESMMPVKVDKTPGRNEPCFCGSGKKYKLCHGR
jgi:preprotein translocase subunit SecA